MKDLKTYRGEESHRIFNIAVIGLPMAGKTALMIQMNDYMKNLSFPNSYGKIEVNVDMQTSAGLCKTKFIDLNVKDYFKASEQEWKEIALADCLLVVCECKLPSVQEAIKLVKLAQKHSKPLTFIVANKSDDYDVNMIKQDELNGLAYQVGAQGIMISAMTGLNMEHLQFLIPDLLMNPQQKYTQVMEQKKSSSGDGGKKKKACSGQ